MLVGLLSFMPMWSYIFDTLHRSQNRKIFDIRYFNKDKQQVTILVRKFSKAPFSNQIQWRLFGRILRRSEIIPARQRRTLSYIKVFNKFPGYSLSISSTMITQDEKKQHKTTAPNWTQKVQGLEHLTTLAKNLHWWKVITKNILAATHAAAAKLED